MQLAILNQYNHEHTRKNGAATVKVKFWGTRGSLPQAMSHKDWTDTFEYAAKLAESKGITTIAEMKLAVSRGDMGVFSYGGNTTCTEVSHGDHLFLVDMGSGLREAGTYLMGKGRKEFHIFLTHMHWDHIMGLPFFVPVHVPGFVTHIHHIHKNTPEFVKINFNGVNFPLTWDQLGGKIEFHAHKLYETVKIGDVAIRSFVLDHPGGSFGFRFDAGGKSVVIGVDGEFKRISPKELGKDLEFYQNLDMLIFDAQYEMAELASRFDWGHCSPNIGVDLALREKIRNLVFTHHDPWATPEKLRRMYAHAKTYLGQQKAAFESTWADVPAKAPQLTMAYDGLVLDLDNL